MNPYKLREVYKQLTSQNSILKKYLKLGTKDIKQPDLPAFVEQKNVVNEFMRRNPRPDQLGRKDMAGGGMLVQPGFDGTRQGYANPDPKVATKEFIEQRDKGKGIPIVREYLRKVLKRKDSINFKDIADIKKKAGLPKNAKIDSDISRLINTEEFKDKVTTDLKKKQLGQTETFRNILRDIKKTIPKGNKQFINVSYIAKKYEIPGKPDSGGFYRVLQEPEFADTFVGLTQDTRSNPQIIRFAEEFERLYEISDVDEDFFRQLAINIYGDDKPRTIRAVGSDASKYAEFLYGVREVTDANGNKLKLPNVEKRGDYLFELIDETLALQEGEKGKVKPITYDQGIVRDRMFAIRDGLLGLKQGQTELQRTNIKKLLKKGYNLDEVAGLAATHEIAPGYTELVQGLKKKINADKMVKIDKPFSRIFEQVITGQKPTKGYKYNNKFYQDINEVVKLYNKDAAAYGKKYGIDVPLIEYKPGKKINPKNFLPNFKYLSPEAKANVQDLASKGIGVRTEAVTMSQFEKMLAGVSGNPQCQMLIRMRKADGGRIGYQSGTVSLSKCAEDGARVINSGMKNANSTQLKNFAAFANRAKNLGRNVMKFGVIPEAMYVAADATVRLTMGDKPIEALLRASEYLLPGDQTKLAEMMEATRLMNPETAAIIGRSIDYKNQLAKIDSLTSQRDNLENLSGGGEFDYIGDLNQDVLNLNNQIKQATDALNTTFKMTDAEQIYANRMQDEVDDIRKSKSLLTKLKSKFRDVDLDSDVETLTAPEVTQEQLNLKMAPQLPRDLLLAPESELLGYAKYQQSQGFKIPDDYYVQQQKDIKNMSLAELAAATSPEQVYGASGTMGEPVNIDLNLYQPSDRFGSGFQERPILYPEGRNTLAGGGIAKEAGVDSGPPPESGPNPQGLSYLMKRVKNI